MDAAVERWHATAIAVAGRAALIVGKSGSGKSDLALRCLAVAPSGLIPNPAVLVADDQVMIERRGIALALSAPEQIAGKLEVRGLGIVKVPSAAPANLVCIAEISPLSEIARFPDPWPVRAVLGLSVPVLKIAPFEPSAPVKLLVALTNSLLPPVAIDAVGSLP